MLTRVVVALSVVVAVIVAFAGDQIPMDLGSVALVVLGLIYGSMCVDSDSRVNYSVIAIAVGAASAAGVLGMIPYVGMYLQDILGGIVIALFSGVVAVLAVGIWDIIMPSAESDS